MTCVLLYYCSILLSSCSILLSCCSIFPRQFLLGEVCLLCRKRSQATREEGGANSETKLYGQLLSYLLTMHATRGDGAVRYVGMLVIAKPTSAVEPT